MHEKTIFHVHSWRCGHAENISDKAYVEKAVEMGAGEIVFTDHAPFPGNPFYNRMHMEKLPEYISTLSELKNKFKESIIIKIGLEIEYLPSFENYYHTLLDMPELDLLLLGQHFFEVSPGSFCFNNDRKSDKEYRLNGIMEAQIKGIESGFFKVIAHPDRCFRDMNFWNPKMEQLSKKFVKAADKHHIILEKNLSSMKKEKEYWSEFWNLVPTSIGVINGCDAHFLSELSF